MTESTVLSVQAHISIKSVISTRFRPGDGYVMANLDPSLYVLCPAVQAGMVKASGEVIRNRCFPWMAFGGGGG